MDFRAYGLLAQTEEAKMAAIRNIRNQKLSECDWTQLADVPLSDEMKTAWQMYRQALRDLPEGFATADEVVFPETPSTPDPMP